MDLKDIIEKAYHNYSNYHRDIVFTLIVSAGFVLLPYKFSYKLMLATMISSGMLAWSVYRYMEDTQIGMSESFLEVLYDDADQGVLVHEGDSCDVYKIMGKRKVELESVDLHTSGLWKAKTADGSVYIADSFVDDLLHYRRLYDTIEYEYEALLTISKSNRIQDIRVRRIAK